MTRPLGFLLIALALSGCAVLPPRAALSEAIAYFRVEPVAADEVQAIHVLRIDLARPGVALEVTPGEPSAGREYRAATTSAFLAKNQLQAAVNGGFFEPFRGGGLGGEDYYPRAGDPVDAIGLAMSAGRVVSAPEAEGRHAHINGVVCIRRPATVSVSRGRTCPEGTDDALGAGPMLLAGGARQDLSMLGVARHPRTAIGVSADGRTAWFVVVDGRQPFWSLGATLHEVTEVFERLGAAHALNLDGGGSSTLAVDGPEGPRVVNSPVHTGVPGRERPVANHLGVRYRAGSP